MTDDHQARFCRLFLMEARLLSKTDGYFKSCKYSFLNVSLLTIGVRTGTVGDTVDLNLNKCNLPPGDFGIL